jgi:hypothetical protein
MPGRKLNGMEEMMAGLYLLLAQEAAQEAT